MVGCVEMVEMSMGQVEVCRGCTGKKVCFATLKF